MLTLAVDAPIHPRSTDEEVEKTLFKIVYCDNATRFLLFFGVFFPPLSVILELLKESLGALLEEVIFSHCFDPTLSTESLFLSPFMSAHVCMHACALLSV